MKQIPKTEEEWKKALSSKQYEILREKGTEPAFTGEYWSHHESGDYKCAACGEVLFSSDTKFDSGTGWPSFTNPKNKTAVILKKDNGQGMQRIEVICKKCGSHLGHVFPDGPKGANRYCINSACLNFTKQNKS
jgi:peptide-methionine (R)-S-oxide reductase